MANVGSKQGADPNRLQPKPPTAAASSAPAAGAIDGGAPELSKEAAGAIALRDEIQNKGGVEYFEIVDISIRLDKAAAGSSRFVPLDANDAEAVRKKYGPRVAAYVGIQLGSKTMTAATLLAPRTLEESELQSGRDASVQYGWSYPVVGGGSVNVTVAVKHRAGEVTVQGRFNGKYAHVAEDALARINADLSKAPQLVGINLETLLEHQFDELADKSEHLPALLKLRDSVAEEVRRAK